MRAAVSLKHEGLNYSETWEVKDREEAVQRIQSWLNEFVALVGEYNDEVVYWIGNERTVMPEKRSKVTRFHK